ncbi:hypothetical protein CERZMDRAFT_89587 [Cercospora zeae-maydis SCOH1-5]|uniref:Uncharacterized protein n=1 Tax=Cercospora zeae-maydis SCOH1-5 TaxID=717836 RepID=A0A6A6FWC3_9PEZI|nr:hypothetical protein CERZMDRAFT_89587 [Cercospora zeae-maydis SCOH1-5]
MMKTANGVSRMLTTKSVRQPPRYPKTKSNIDTWRPQPIDTAPLQKVRIANLEKIMPPSPFMPSK